MLKFFLGLILGVTSLFTLVTPASAHLVGQPPFFKINGVYSNLYPVPSSSVESFNLPQDLAAQNYLVNQNLIFEFDEAAMPAPKEVVEKTNFYWDFGDGKTGSGLTNTHTYNKIGSYILTVKAQYGPDPAQIIQSTMIAILPSSNYQLPQAVIKINGKSSKDPLTDVIKTEFNKAIELDGSSSRVGSAKIVSYQWDLGDTQTVSQSKLTHHYDNQLNQVFPVLRVKDENGLISDQFVEIENEPDDTPNSAAISKGQNLPANSQASSMPGMKNISYILGGGVVLALVVFILKFRHRTKSL